MATLVITKTYADGEILTEADLDNIKDDIETLINVTGLNDDNIQNNGITASTKLIDATITTGKIANNAIIAAKIATDAVTTAKILDENVTAAKLSSDAKASISPIGSMILWPTNSPPDDYLMCDGTVVSQTTYAALYAVLGETYNTSGEGAGNFRLPNAIGRTAIGAGSYTDTVEGGVIRTLGQYVGASKHVITGAELASHTHFIRTNDGTILTQMAPYGGATSFAGFAQTGNEQYIQNNNFSQQYIQDAGSNVAHNNMQPSFVANYVIRYQ